jgi:hypothetical protein
MDPPRAEIARIMSAIPVERLPDVEKRSRVLPRMIMGNPGSWIDL